MRLCILTICTCLATTVFSGPVKLGDTKDTVIGALGRPMGMVKKGEIEILLFANGEVELRNGRVDRMTVPQAEDIPPATPAQARPPSGLTLRYAFDETGAVIHDHSGHGRSANVHGALPSAQGKHHGAYEFNGRDAYIQTASPIDLAPPYTLTAWVYLRSRLTDGGDFSFYRGRTIMERGDLNRSGAWDYIFNVNANGKLGFVTHSAFSRADMLQNPEDFPLNRWVFVAFTHEGLTGRLYQDGRLVRTSAQMHAGNNHKGPGTFIGKVFNSHPASRGDHFWDGWIDELRIYNKALSASELGEVQREAPLAVVGPSVAEPSPPSALQPVFHLSFDDGSCMDVGGRAHHGTSHNARPVAGEPNGKAMKLDGLESYISVERSQEMTLGAADNRSILLWWKADLIDEQNQSLLSMRSIADSARGLAVELFKGKYYRLHLRFYHHADFPAALQPRQWNHLAVVKQGVEWRLYHNGELLTDPVLGRWPFVEHANADVPLWIGRDHTGDNPFGGLIDEVLFFDIALSESDVKQIYSKERRWSGSHAARPVPANVAPVAERPASRPAPVRAELKSGELSVTLLKSMGGPPHVGVDIAMSPPYPGARQLVARTDAAGSAKLQIADGSYLVSIGGQVVGPIDVSRSSPWTACTVVFPADYPNPPVGRPDLRPTIVGDAMVLIAEQIPQVKQPPR